MSGVSEVLSAAADLLERPGAWTQGALCRDESGRELSRGYDFHVAEKASCWCLEGALIVAARGDGDLITKGIAALQKVTDATPFAWNDRPERTQSEVVSAFRAAITRADGGGALRASAAEGAGG